MKTTDKNQPGYKLGHTLGTLTWMGVVFVGACIITGIACRVAYHGIQLGWGLLP